MSVGLEVDSQAYELVEDHNAELTTEELQDLHMEQQQEVAMELSSEEEKVDSKGSIPTADIKELLVHWSKSKTQPCREVAPQYRSREHEYQPV